MVNESINVWCRCMCLSFAYGDLSISGVLNKGNIINDPLSRYYVECGLKILKAVARE
jgi:hypothetical protein